jgi:hypothetical protein
MGYPEQSRTKNGTTNLRNKDDLRKVGRMYGAFIFVKIQWMLPNQPRDYLQQYGVNTSRSKRIDEHAYYASHWGHETCEYLPSLIKPETIARVCT